MHLAAVYNRMPVSESINMPVQDYTLANGFRIFQVIAPFDIITDIVADDNIIRIA
jgi:hypothetical protein